MNTKLAKIRGGTKCVVIALAAMMNSLLCAVADDAYIASQVYSESGYGAVTSNNVYSLDTGYVPGPNTAVFVDFELLALSSDVGWSRPTQIIFEATDDGTGNAVGSARAYVNGNGDLAWVFTEGNNDKDQYNSTHISAETGKRYSFMIDGPSRKTVLIYGESSKTMDFPANLQNVQATTSLKVFSCATMDLKVNPSMMKLYAFKIYESGELVRDYIPAIKGGRSGLYDRVGGGFISNYKPAGVAFVYGGDITNVEDDGYIESDGTAFVNSRYFMNPQSKIEVDYALTDAETPSEYKYVFGAADTSSSDTIKTHGGFFTSSNGKPFFIAGDAIKGWNAPAAAVDTCRRIAVLDVLNAKYHYYVHGQADVSGNLKSGLVFNNTATYPVAFFGNMAGTNAFSASGLAKVRIYRAKFWNGDTLVHDYVPCVQGGLAGFKDNVDGAFVTAAGGSDLTYGGNIAVEPGPGYIANSGKAMFDTGFKPGPNSRIEVDYLCGSTNSANSIFCIPSGALFVRHYINSSGNYAWNYMDTKENTASLGLKVWPGRRRTFVIDSKEDFVGLITAGYTNYASTVTAGLSGKEPGTRNNTATQNLFLFSNGLNANAKFISDLRLYGCRIYDNGTLVRNYIPYVKDGVAGLYDSVNDTFAGSSTNSYSFAAGGEIMTNGRDDAYVETDGTQAFNTGYHVKPNTRIEADFRYMEVVASQNAMFGAWDCTTGNKCGGYVNANGNFAMRFDGGDANSSGMVKANTDRHTAILDGSSRKYYYMTGVTTNKTADAAGTSSSETANHTLGIMASVSAMTGDEVSTWKHAQTKARLYSFRIYETENGVQSLVHEYLPYKKGDVVGLYDTVTRTILTDARGSATPVTIGGKGVDGAERYLVQPLNCTVSKPRSEATLTANASGAVSYKWTKNGAAIVGGENGELAVSWVKNGGTDTYTVTPVYDIYGCEVEGSPVACTVEHAPMGLMILIR